MDNSLETSTGCLYPLLMRLTSSYTYEAVFFQELLRKNEKKLAIYSFHFIFLYMDNNLYNSKIGDCDECCHEV